MAEPFMAPRGYTYSGGAMLPYSDRPGVGSAPAVGTEPAPGSSSGGFLAGLNQVAGVLADIVEGFQRGRRGYATTPDAGRMGGNRFMSMIMQQLESSRARNEAAAERARQERKESQKKGFEQQILLEGVRQGKISYEEALNRLKSFDALTNGESLGSSDAVEAN